MPTPSKTPDSPTSKRARAVAILPTLPDGCTYETLTIEGDGFRATLANVAVGWSAQIGVGNGGEHHAVYDTLADAVRGTVTGIKKLAAAAEKQKAAEAAMADAMRALGKVAATESGT